LDRQKLYEEIKEYSYDDLELILETQRDLYSVEEMEYIESRLNELKEIEKVERLKKLPKEIICPKCDQPNPFENDVCIFCQFQLDKSKYFRDDYSPETDEDNYDQEDDKSFEHKTNPYSCEKADRVGDINLINL